MRFRKSNKESNFEPFETPLKKNLPRRHSEPTGDLRKVHQLCAQVREVLSLALAERWSNPLIERVFIVSVTPAPDAGRLLVTVGVGPGEPVEASTLLESLKALRPELRHEIAAEIHRKKTPELVFDLAPNPSA